MTPAVRITCARCGEVAVPVCRDIPYLGDATRTVLAYVTAHEIDAHADELLVAS